MKYEMSFTKWIRRDVFPRWGGGEQHDKTMPLSPLNQPAQTEKYFASTPRQYSFNHNCNAYQTMRVSFAIRTQMPSIKARPIIYKYLYINQFRTSYQAAE